MEERGRDDAMVKGVSRRVIVVKSPDPRLFEQAIFIVRENSSGTTGVTAEQILEEARRVAKGYIHKNTGPGRYLKKIPAPAFMAAGAGFTGLIWLLVALL